MPGDPRSGSKLSEAPDLEIGKPRENRGQIAAHGEFQSAAAFHDRENRLAERARGQGNGLCCLDLAADIIQERLGSFLTHR
jgi:hypothetical protein